MINNVQYLLTRDTAQSACMLDIGSEWHVTVQQNWHSYIDFIHLVSLRLHATKQSKTPYTKQ